MASDSTPSALFNEYFEAVKRPADVVFDFCSDDNDNPEQEASAPRPVSLFSLSGDSEHAAYLAGVEDAFVLPRVLSPAECADLIRKAETDGIVPPSKHAGTLRTAKRTDQYQNEALSELVRERVGTYLSAQFSKDSSPRAFPEKHFGEFSRIHANWRVLRYDVGDSFPAHQDQMDSLQYLDPKTGTKDFVVSTHTLLIQLSPPRPAAGGGATRFYPRTKIGGKASTLGQYEYSVDIRLPQGWAVVFPQFGMVHAGQPVLALPGDENTSSGDSNNSTNASPANCKYVAQAGVLRTLPPGRLFKPNVFRLGPGLRDVA